MLAFFHPPDCVIWCYLLGRNHFLSIKKGNLPRICWGNFWWRFPVPPTERVWPGQRIHAFFPNRGTTFISSISTLWSRAILSFFFLVRGKPEGVKLCSACSSCFQSGDAFLKPKTNLVIWHAGKRKLLDTQLEGPEVWESWIFKEKDKIQPFWFLLLWKVRMKDPPFQ